MTRLQAIRYLRNGGTLTACHNAITCIFSSNLHVSDDMVKCTFKGVHPFSSVYKLYISHKQTLSYIKRNYNR